MNTIAINLQTKVLVQVREPGKLLYNHYHRQLGVYPKELAPDAEGYYSFTLGDFIQIFGPGLQAGGEPPIGPEIRLALP